MEITKIIFSGTNNDEINNMQYALSKNKNTLSYKKTPFEIITLPNNLKNAELSHFFMNTKENFFVINIIKQSNFYNDILYAVNILSVCKDVFILFLNDTDSLKEDFCFFLEEKLKTHTVFLNINKKKFKKRLKKHIFSFHQNPKKSEFENIYPTQLKSILKNLEDALYKKNIYLKNLAPVILTSSKLDITKLDNILGFDILDNIKILKAMCVAMEFMENCNIKKCDLKKRIQKCNEDFAWEILKNSDNYKK